VVLESGGTGVVGPAWAPAAFGPSVGRPRLLLVPSLGVLAGAAAVVGAAGGGVVVAGLVTGAVVVVAPGGAVVVVAPGAVVVLVPLVASLVDRLASTGRNSSLAVSPISARARSGSLMPGSWMTTVLPWRTMSGSATPSPSTRLRMISLACSTASELALPLAWRVTERPP